MPRTPIMGAGGIVVRGGPRPLIALVQRSKDDAWVLPKGKLKRKEAPVPGVAADPDREISRAIGDDVVGSSMWQFEPKAQRGDQCPKGFIVVRKGPM